MSKDNQRLPKTAKARLVFPDESAHFAYNVKICISLFVCGLPAIPAFNTLRADLPHHIAAISDDHDYSTFIGLTDTVLELNTIFRPTSLSQSSCPSRLPPAVPPSAPPTAPTSSLPTNPPCVPKQELSCGNCKSRGLCYTRHTNQMCFHPGGGMEGHCEEYMANKGCVYAVFAECL